MPKSSEHINKRKVKSVPDNAKDNNDTTLHLSINILSILAKKLIKCEAEVNAQDDDDNNPLHTAVIFENNSETSSLLGQSSQDNCAS